MISVTSAIWGVVFESQTKQNVHPPVRTHWHRAIVSIFITFQAPYYRCSKIIVNARESIWRRQCRSCGAVPCENVDIEKQGSGGRQYACVEAYRKKVQCAWAILFFFHFFTFRWCRRCFHPLCSQLQRCTFHISKARPRSFWRYTQISKSYILFFCSHVFFRLVESPFLALRILICYQQSSSIAKQNYILVAIKCMTFVRMWHCDNVRICQCYNAIIW